MKSVFVPWGKKITFFKGENFKGNSYCCRESVACFAEDVPFQSLIQFNFQNSTPAFKFNEVSSKGHLF